MSTASAARDQPKVRRRRRRRRPSRRWATVGGFKKCATGDKGAPEAAVGGETPNASRETRERECDAMARWVARARGAGGGQGGDGADVERRARSAREVVGRREGDDLRGFAIVARATAAECVAA